MPSHNAIHPAPARTLVLKNTFVLLSGQAALMLGSAVTTFVLARQLGSERFGEYNGVLTFVGLFLPIAIFGLDSMLVREMSAAPQRARITFGTGLILQLAASVVAILCCIGASIYFGYSAQEKLLIGIWSVSLMFAGGQLFQVAYTLELNNSKPIRLSTAIALGGTIVKLLLVLTKAELIAYVVCDLVVSIVTSFSLWRIVRHHPEFSPEWRFDWEISSRLLRGGLPLMLTSILIASYHRIDQQFLLRWKGPGELGQYAAAVRMAEMLSLFPVFFMRSAFPIISSLSVESQEKPLRISASCYRYLFLLNLPAIFLGILLAPQIINLVYGPAYSSAADALPWLLGAEIPVIAGVVVGQFIVAAGLQNFTVIFCGINFAANLLLCIALIPRSGIYGAAIASFIGYGISIPIQMIFTATRPYATVLIWEMLRAASVGLVTWIAFVLSSWFLPLILTIVLSASVFCCASISMKLIRREDMRLVQELKEIA